MITTRPKKDGLLHITSLKYKKTLRRVALSGKDEFTILSLYSDRALQELDGSCQPGEIIIITFDEEEELIEFLLGNEEQKSSSQNILVKSNDISVSQTFLGYCGLPPKREWKNLSEEEQTDLLKGAFQKLK